MLNKINGRLDTAGKKMGDLEDIARETIQKVVQQSPLISKHLHHPKKIPILYPLAVTPYSLSPSLQPWKPFIFWSLFHYLILFHSIHSIHYLILFHYLIPVEMGSYNIWPLICDLFHLA